MKKTTIMVAVMAGLSMSASAALVTEYNTGFNAGQVADNVDLGTSIAADAGDVIVFSAASSKSYVKSYSVVSADGGVVGAEVGIWLDKGASVSYFTVTAGGTFDLGVVGNAATYDTFGAYVLGSDQAGYSVGELANDTSYVGANVSVTNTLDLGTLDFLNNGVVIEAATLSSFVSYPAGLNIFENSGTSRASAWASVADGALTSEWIGADITKNSRTAGIAFTEVIPEPATLGMFAALGGALLFMRRRFVI